MIDPVITTSFIIIGVLGIIALIPFFFDSNLMYVLRHLLGRNAKKVTFFDVYGNMEYYYIQVPTPVDNTDSFAFTFNSNRFPNSIKQKYSFWISDSFKPDGVFVKKGTPLCRINIENSYSRIYSYILSPIDGYLEYIYEQNGDNLLHNKDLILKVHLRSSQSNMEENPDVHYYYFDQMYDTLGQVINYDVLFLCNDGEKVHVGQEIFELSSTISDETIVIEAKHEGYVDHLIDNFSTLNINKTKVLSINYTDTIRVNRKYPNIPLTDFDEFTQNTNIRWRLVSGDDFGVSMYSDDRSLNIKFSFYHIDLKDWIVFHFAPNKIKFDINDEILFLFENDEVISFKLQNKTQRPILYNSNKVIEYRFLLTDQDISLFANYNLTRFKIELKSQKSTYLGGNAGDYLYSKKDNLQIAVRKFANDFIDSMQSYFPDHQFPNIQTKSKITELKKNDNACYLYLMKDTSTLYYKIGISNSPQYREKTLQSEKPTIQLCASKRYPVRKIAESFEKALHETYKDQRVRGEWFSLTDTEVAQIIESLS